MTAPVGPVSVEDRAELPVATKGRLAHEFRATPDAQFQEVGRVPLEVRIGPVPANA